ASDTLFEVDVVAGVRTPGDVFGLRLVQDTSGPNQGLAVTYFGDGAPNRLDNTGDFFSSAESEFIGFDFGMEVELVSIGMSNFDLNDSYDLFGSTDNVNFTRIANNTGGNPFVFADDTLFQWLYIAPDSRFFSTDQFKVDSLQVFKDVPPRDVGDPGVVPVPFGLPLLLSAFGVAAIVRQRSQA
ncbi:MAG: hypothetical protein AAF763_09225, partial [Pseudomonadota bacterium]